MLNVPTHVRFTCDIAECDWKTELLWIRDVAQLPVPPDAEHADSEGHCCTTAHRGNTEYQNQKISNCWE